MSPAAPFVPLMALDLAAGGLVAARHVGEPPHHPRLHGVAEERTFAEDHLVVPLGVRTDHNSTIWYFWTKEVESAGDAASRGCAVSVSCAAVRLTLTARYLPGRGLAR